MRAKKAPVMIPFPRPSEQRGDLRSISWASSTRSAIHAWPPATRPTKGQAVERQPLVRVCTSIGSDRFAPDAPLEEAGFEPSVPPRGRRRGVRYSALAAAYL